MPSDNGGKLAWGPTPPCLIACELLQPLQQLRWPHPPRLVAREQAGGRAE